MQFTISCPIDNVLELLDLTLSFDATSKQIQQRFLVTPPTIMP